MAFRLVLSTVLGICMAPVSAQQAGGERVVLETVGPYQVSDPLFECVRVVMNQRGEPYSAAYIQGISGAAFRTAGPCPCAPTCSAAMSTEELVRRLGYRAESIGVAKPGRDLAPETPKTIARIKDEIRAGRSVIVFHAFTYAEFDVVAGFDETKKQFLGRGTYFGREDFAAADEARFSTCGDICPTLGAILVQEKVGQLDARAAELDALETAVRHAHTPPDRYLTEVQGRKLPWRFHEGLACYDAWIAGLERDPARETGIGDHYPLSVYQSTHRSAGPFLLELATKYPEAAEALKAAAAGYDGDAEALGKCLELVDRKVEDDQSRTERNRELLGLLREARGHYAAGAEQVLAALRVLDPERAERALKPACVRREGNRVWVTEVPGINWPGKVCSVCSALWAATARSEAPYAYSDYMGLSGLAFRTRWCNEATKTKWCGSVAIGEMPDEFGQLSELTGWQFSVADQFDTEKPDYEAMRTALVAAIDAGRPVMAYPSGGDLNVGLVYGYADGGKTLLVRPYGGPEPTVDVPLESIGPMQFCLTSHTAPPSLADGLTAALNTAVARWDVERHDGGLPGREYWYGRAAFDAWVRDLRQFETYSAETQKAMYGIDGWNLSSLVDARKAAVQFLGDMACVADDEAGAAMGRAKGLYQSEVDLLAPVSEERSGVVSVEAWSSEQRKQQADALAKARDIEAEAVTALRDALAAL